VALSAVYILFRVPSMTSRDSEALNLAASILSRGESSRLYRKLVYEEKIAQSVDAFQVDMEDPGVFVVNAVVSPGRKPEEVEARIRKEIRTLAASPPDHRELRKVKNQLSSEWVKQLSRAMGRADNLAHFHTFFGDAGMINSYLDKFLAVTSKEVRAVAETYLDTDDSVVVYYLPKQS